MSNYKDLKRKLSLFETRRLKLEQDKEDLVRSLGWEETSNFPDCYWRWVKTFPNGKTITIPSNMLDSILELESRISEGFKKNDGWNLEVTNDGSGTSPRNQEKER